MQYQAIPTECMKKYCIFRTHCDTQSLELMAVTVFASLFSTFGTQVLIGTALRTDGRCHRVVDCGTGERHPSDSQSFPVSCLRDAFLFFLCPVIFFYKVSHSVWLFIWDLYSPSGS